MGIPANTERWHWEFIGTMGNWQLLQEGSPKESPYVIQQIPPDMQPTERMKLAASTPELLNVVQAVVNWYENAGNADPDRESVGSVELWQQAKAAIKKAKGE